MTPPTAQCCLGSTWIHPVHTHVFPKSSTEHLWNPAIVLVISLNAACCLFYTPVIVHTHSRWYDRYGETTPPEKSTWCKQGHDEIVLCNMLHFCSFMFTFSLNPAFCTYYFPQSSRLLLGLPYILPLVLMTSLNPIYCVCVTNRTPACWVCDFFTSSLLCSCPLIPIFCGPTSLNPILLCLWLPFIQSIVFGFSLNLLYLWPSATFFKYSQLCSWHLKIQSFVLWLPQTLSLCLWLS